ncbi:MAG: YchF-related putative GTPase [Nitrososphaeria archaeon]
MTFRIALIGKTNAGKTTIFDTATGINAPIGNYTFTTKEPSVGIAYVTSPCVHKEFGVNDNPINSKCVAGWRYIPIELMDMPGLIKGASAGRGLGTRFLAVAATSDAFLHVVDASGSIDEDGKIAEPGSGNPLLDYREIEGEIIQWYKSILENNIEKIIKKIEESKTEMEAFNAIYEVLAGIKVTKDHIIQALGDIEKSPYDVKNMKDKELWALASKIREISKPTLVIANKMDIPTAEQGFKSLKETLKDKIIVPVSGNYELILKKAVERNVIEFNAAEDNYIIKEAGLLKSEEKRALDFVNKFSMKEMMRTGIQFAINVGTFKLLRMNVVYPVADLNKLSDKKGHVLPDAMLVPDGTTVKDLAAQIHTDLAKGLLYAIDARTGLRLPPTYKLKDRDVISIVSATRKQ